MFYDMIWPKTWSGQVRSVRICSYATVHTYVERGISCTKIVVHQTDEMTKSSLCKNEKPFSNKSFACCVSITYGNRIDGPTVL